jgi:predicted aldo/keto reductase-like oxidoreductase
MKEHRVLEWAEKTKRQGKIGHIGFSFHDSFKLFKEIVDSYDQWDLCQIQYNYMNENVQAGKAGLKYAADRGIAVVIMEPLLGGILANPPKSIQSIFDESDANPADIALRWLWNLPEVACVLSGMSNLEQVEKNIKYAGHSGIGQLSMSENEIVEKAKARFREKNLIPCTKCRYCMPCPNGVNIPHNFEVYNDAAIYENANLSKTH